MISERGMQTKADVTSRGMESAEFPILCETCLGDVPYVRMAKYPFAGSCKMCDRPFTIFKWRPGRGEGYRKTEVCQTCSKIKNLCQTCILDLQFGLPSQLRDAVLARGDDTGGSIASMESDVNKEFAQQQQLRRLQSGEMQPGDNPNERLITMAKDMAARASDANREDPRINIHVNNFNKRKDRSDDEDDPVYEASKNGAGFNQVFVPSQSFTGRREGFYFTMGRRGLGYYTDRLYRSRQAHPVSSSSSLSSPLSITLSQSVPLEGQQSNSIGVGTDPSVSLIAGYSSSLTATSSSGAARMKPRPPSGPPPASAFQS